MITLRLNKSANSLWLDIPLSKRSIITFDYCDRMFDYEMAELEAVAIALKLKYPKTFKIAYQDEEPKNG